MNKSNTTSEVDAKLSSGAPKFLKRWTWDTDDI
jgi:hypothetical protein